MGKLVLENLSLSYAGQPVIEDLNLTVNDGEMVSLLGPSGAGKTTILKAIAGLLKPSRGQIYIDDRQVNRLPPEHRDAVMVFQKPLLFPFMNVSQNIAFGLRMSGSGQRASRKRIAEILEMTQLTGLDRRKVHQLSGGQQQRVSLARALVLQPAVLLLDEPLSNLDANLRQQMRELIQEIQTRTRITTLFVTHDQIEALMISHRVSLLLDGKLRQMGSPQQLYYQPRDRDVARFFGGANFFSGQISNGHLKTDLGDFAVRHNRREGEQAQATIRPEDIRLSRQADYPLSGRVQRANFEGAATRVWVQVNSTELVVLNSDGDWVAGQPVWIKLPPDKICVFARQLPQEPPT